MKKTISITLNGLVFNIVEDAYTKLHSYLDALKNHFGSTEYGKEVINDIESRFAEQFNSSLKIRKVEAITGEQLDEILKNMGSVDDLTGGAKNMEQDTERVAGRRRLYRNPEDVIVAGVSSGISSYFNIDPLIPRILFFVSAFMGGWGLVVYALLWIIIPKAQTSSQQLEMKGNAVNIANLEENLKEKQAKKENFSVVRYFFRELFYLFGRFLRVLGPLILSIIGILVTAVAFVAMFAVTLLTLLLLFDPNSPYIDPAITQVFNGSEYVFLVSSGFVSALIPILVALLIGISLIRHKNTFTTSIFIAFAVLWVSSGLMFGYLATSAAPQIDAAVKSIESRPESSKEFQVENFESIKSQRDERVKITYGPQTKVMAFGREEELEDLTISVESGVLVFNYDDDFRICIFCINKPTTFEIITPNISRVHATNASRVDVSGFNNITEFEIWAHNASRVVFNGKVQTMTVDLNNASRVDLVGSAKNLSSNLSNASRLEASEFTAETVIIEATNSSDAEVNATQRIEASATGASHIRYSGTPEEEIIDESNAARITGN